MFLIIVIYIKLGGKKNWELQGKKSGISTVQGIVNTETVQGPTESLELVSGKLQELTDLFTPLMETNVLV